MVKEGIHNSIWGRGEVMLCDDVISEAVCIIISFPPPTIMELVLDPYGCKVPFHVMHMLQCHALKVSCSIEFKW